MAVISAAAAALPRLLDPLADCEGFWEACWWRVILFSMINGAIGVTAYIALADAALAAHWNMPAAVSGLGGTLISQVVIRLEGPVPAIPSASVTRT